MEGVVKFNCHWSQSGPVISDEQYEIINYWREVLFNMDLIGAYENGVCFGNISMRAGSGNQCVGSLDYGTAGLAKDVLRLFNDSDVFEKRIIIMAGDRAGILTFGHNMDEAVTVLLQYLRKEE